MKNKWLLGLLMLVATSAGAQQLAFGRQVVDTLTSPFFWGRGYTNNGMQKAAQYLTGQFALFGLMPLKGNSFTQPFSYPVNTFPGKMEVRINGVRLTPGADFIVGEESKGVKASAALIKQDSTHFVNMNERVVVELKDKLTWSVAPRAANYTAVYIDKKALTTDPTFIEVNIENKTVGSFKAANVCGKVTGTQKPDSVVMITAHYDHLGGMGSNTYFAGANDNASGIALLLGLAKYYAQHPAPYTMVFICFAGEEAGLLGSKYFVNHPLVPLKSVRFLTNIDLAGTGSEGITVVNATEFAAEFKMLNVANSSRLLTAINARGKAANSDHYWFTENGVPSFFIYTLGGIKAYHDVFDISATLPLNEYEDLLKLIVGFNKKLME